MSYTDEQIEQAIKGSRDALSRRLRALSKRAYDFDLEAVHCMHQNLDRFRTEQQQRLVDKREAE